MLKLLNYGQTKEGNIIIYTYVIVNEFLRFSPTGKLLKNVLSKHNVHSNCSSTVTYAGEFHIQVEHGEYVMIFNNSSGTYKPDPEDLPLVKDLLVINFPGLRVKVVPHGSEQLNKYLQNVQTINLSNK